MTAAVRLLLCVGFVVLVPRLLPAAAADDEADVRAVLATQEAAWNKGDLDGFMAGYWQDDGLFYISGGKSVQGYKALKERYQAAYQGEGKEMGKLKFTDLKVEPLGPNVALVRGKWEVTTSKETVGGWFTLVMKKFPDGWKVTHDHTSK
ncbi:MAG: nuclear transport factor 2 family protein [Gemmataceae bacterium]|nr:nuclear transport factor 2 family protein [Gemmataceae bacterium]